MSTRVIVASLLLLSAVLVVGCDGNGPMGPSLSRDELVPPAPEPQLPPASPADTWNITMRMTSVEGGECVGDTLQSEIGEPKSYTLAIAPTDGTVDVTLRSASGDYDCTFTGGRLDESGFTFGATDGYFSCEPGAGGDVPAYVCDNGARRNMFALGQYLDGDISGDEIRGRLNVLWSIREISFPGQRPVEIALLETLSEYSGSR